MFKEQKGITLVALVITIIVLLILAGVSISLVMGDNGILTQAQTAVSRNQIATVKEKISTSFAAVDVAYYAEWTSNQSKTRAEVYKDLIVSELEANGLTVDETASTFLTNADGDFIGSATISFDGVTYTITDIEVDKDSGALKMKDPEVKTAPVDNTAE